MSRSPIHAPSSFAAALRERNVVADYRGPNIIRLAPSPLYNSFDDCFEAVEQLRSIMDHSEC